MNRRPVSHIFLYKYRFIIGYIVLVTTFLGLIFTMPAFSPDGISNAEMQSVVESHNLSWESLRKGDVADLPYRFLQKTSIAVFGLSNYSIKLPSILLSVLLGVFLTLLLNRWFKSNVALTASSIIVLSTPFLFLSGMGVSTILVVLYPTVLLWLGSKIQNNPKPRSIYLPIFVFIAALSIFTPQMIYFVLAVILFAISHPHIRFTIKRMNIALLILTLAIIILPVAMMIYFALIGSEDFSQIFFPTGFSINDIPVNINTAFKPFITWSGTLESVVLSPLIGLSILSLATIGLISTSKNFFKTKISIAFAIAIFTIVISGINSRNIFLIVIPIAILVAYGINYIFSRWYSIFPENPYARFFALIPITIFIAIINLSDLSHYFFGYHYTPTVANHFNDDICLIKANLKKGDAMVLDEGQSNREFYKILARSLDIEVLNSMTENLSGNKLIATLGKHKGEMPQEIQLYRIITSSKTIESDRIYLYTYKN